MQVKKFEAPTIQEALDTIKRELGPDAIILQTKKHKRGFGLMSRASIEVTAAVSERSLQKKQYVEKRIPETAREAVKKLPAEKQVEFYAKAAPQTERPASSASSQGIAQGVAQRMTPKREPETAPNPAQARQAGAGAVAGTAYRSFSTATSSNSANMGSAPVDALLGRSSSYTASVQKTAPPQAATPQVPTRVDEQAMITPKVTSRRYAEIDDFETSDALQANAAKNGPPYGYEDELKQLKRMIEELKSVQDSAQEFSGRGALSAHNERGAVATPALQGALEQLVFNGLEKRYALALVKTVSFELGPERSENPDEVMDQLASEIMKNSSVLSPLALVARRPAADPDRRREPAVLALVGPTGVGKTTTVAKLASEAVLKHNLRVGLINLDSYKIAAFDQLGTYAKILGVPFRSVTTASELREAVLDFQSLDLVLVDTTGRSQRDPQSLREMRELVASVPGIVSQLVLSVTTRDAELYDMANRFSIFSPQGIIVSKLDESTSHGAIYNILMKTKLPLLCFTTGQRVPEDIEDATPERVAALLLDI